VQIDSLSQSYIRAFRDRFDVVVVVHVAARGLGSMMHSDPRLLSQSTYTKTT
jgi:hypothetical protein